MRLKQLSGPVMAKSNEDTLFYRNNRFVALNEVCADPERFGISVENFHAINIKRQNQWPNSLVAIQTHDAKRGEDLRARLLALSRQPEVWREFHEASRNTSTSLAANDQYFLLQNIIGAWPVESISGQPLDPHPAFIARLRAFSTKALREAKQRSSWRNQDERYEVAAHDWIENLCIKEDFLACIRSQIAPHARAGFSFSLVRAAIKLTIPGIPVFYQGCEGADFAFVDPDNRRPVDFGTRSGNFDHASHSFSWRKQMLITTLLNDRLASPALYAKGDYEPLPASQGWVAFRRAWRDEALLVAARINPFTSRPAPAFAVEDADWRNLLLNSALNRCDGDCLSSSAIILKTARNETQK